MHCCLAAASPDRPPRAVAHRGQQPANTHMSHIDCVISLIVSDAGRSLVDTRSGAGCHVACADAVLCMQHVLMRCCVCIMC